MQGEQTGAGFLEAMVGKGEAAAAGGDVLAQGFAVGIGGEVAGEFFKGDGRVRRVEPPYPQVQFLRLLAVCLPALCAPFSKCPQACLGSLQPP